MEWQIANEEFTHPVARCLKAIRAKPIESFQRCFLSAAVDHTTSAVQN